MGTGTTATRSPICSSSIRPTSRASRSSACSPTSSSNGPSASQRPKGRSSPISGLSATATSTPQAVCIKAGATIIGGSDWDISSYNPFRAFQTAVTRAGGKGQTPLNIEERIPLQTAIDAYTINAAYAMKQDTTTGSLEVGKRADLVVLDRDILTIDPETIQDTKVLATYLDGRLVHSASARQQGRG